MTPRCTVESIGLSNILNTVVLGISPDNTKRLEKF
ncbi:thioredoxin domain-containing protein [Francisella persica]